MCYQNDSGLLILDAYFYNSAEIKKDKELSDAYIHIPDMITKLNNEKAALLLDEF